MKRLFSTLIFCFSFLIQFILFSSTKAVDMYSVIPLPEDFYHGNGHILNNHGQIAGRVSQERVALAARDERKKKNPGASNYSESDFDPYEGAKAAYWDPKKGITIINVEAYKSSACSINDNGFVALSVYKDKQSIMVETPRTALWDIKTNAINIGPLGEARNMGKTNVIWLATPRYIGQSILWNPQDNTLLRNPDIGTLKLHFLDIFNYSNSRGTKLFQNNSDLSLFYSGKEYLLVVKEGNLSNVAHAAHLNDNDEVIAMTIVKNGAKDQNVITRWNKGKDATTSDYLQSYPELNDYAFFRIVGFNNKGQILLTATKDSSFYYHNLFLMTPMPL